MKKLLLFLGVAFISSPSYSMNTSKVWKHLNIEQKLVLLDAHLEFLEEYEKRTENEIADFAPKKEWEFFSKAWAQGKLDCVYAGWPSKRISGKCSTPIRNNPSYDSGACKASELQCQPMLFGSGLCVPTNTAKQRSMALSNCNQKFSASGRTPKSVIESIEKDGKQSELFEVMNTTESVCTTGAQKNTPMCARLLSVVEDIKKQGISQAPPAPEKKVEDKPTPPTPPKKEDPPKKEEPPKRDIPKFEPPKREPPKVEPPQKDRTPPPQKPEIIIEGEKVEDPKIQEDLIDTVKQADRINSGAERAGVLMCETSDPLTRINPRAEMATTGWASKDGYGELYYYDENRTKYERGVRIEMNGPNKLAPMIDGAPTQRIWNFVSIDSAINDTYINITDEPTPGTLSHLMETNIVLIPRKEKPRAEKKGDEVHVTLPTGELVIYDAKTNMVKKGAFKEEAIDTNPNRFKRKHTTTYTGEGISIRTERRGADPRIGSGNVTITQKGKSCSLPKNQVWGGNDDRPRFKFSDDTKLVEFLNQKCSSKFSL